MSDHYTEIPSYQEEETSEQYLDPISCRFPLEYDKVFFVKNSTCIDKTELAKKIPENPKIKDARELIDKLTAFS